MTQSGKNIKQASKILDKIDIDIEAKLTGTVGFNRDLETLISDGEIVLEDLWKLVDDKEIVVALKKQGIDGAIFKETGERGTSYAIFNPKQAFFKSQLTDFWNQVQKTKGEAPAMKKPSGRLFER